MKKLMSAKAKPSLSVLEDPAPVGGRLANFTQEWSAITNDPFVLGTVQGHLIQFQRKPPLVRPSPKSEVVVTKAQQGAMQGAITDLLKEGNIERGPLNKGFFTYPFLIPKKDGQLRFIMNLKPLNRYIKCTKFKMTTLKHIREAIRPGCWAVSFDIKSAYCHIPIARRHRCFLRFRWKGQVYQFKTLPFGLSTAPKTFTRTTRPILLYCRKLGIKLFLYLDDGLILAPSYNIAKEHGELVAELVQRLGFVLSWKKCNFEPTQIFTHLGVTFNSKEMTISLPEEKILKVREQAAKVLKTPTCRGVMRLLGLTNFANLGVPLGRLHSRPLQFWLKTGYKSPQDLFHTLSVTPLAEKCLTWWMNLTHTSKSLTRPRVEEVVITDASTAGYGGHLNQLTFQGKWPGHKGKSTHINILELETVWKACQQFEQEIQGKVVSFQIDNTTAVAYLRNEGGTHCYRLYGIARNILLRCHQLGITVCPSYLRGIANLKADALSRGKQTQEWSLNPTAAQRLFKLWGTPVVDLFASSRTFKLPQYFSLDMTDNRAIGHDGARDDWPQGLRYAFPPPPIISLVLANYEKQGGELVMITPYWPDQPWFAELIQLSMEPPRRFKPVDYLLQNATTGELIPRIMREIKLTAWRLSSASAPERVWQNLHPENCKMPGHSTQRKVTTKLLKNGVLSAVEKGYQTFRFV